MNMAVIVFSRNRPLQLDLCLSSFHRHSDVSSYNFWKEMDITTIYTCDPEYQDAYSQLDIEWGDYTHLVKEINFKQDVLNLLKDKTHVLFLVDDCIFTHDFSLKKIVHVLDSRKNTVGFSLRLGKNTNYCYTLDRIQDTPFVAEVTSSMLGYNWTNADGDFGYPAEVSSSVYRVKNFIEPLKMYDFKNPNELESLMNSIANVYMDSDKNTFLNKMPTLSCYEQSVAFCNPCNKVQDVAPDNRSGNKVNHSARNLLWFYNNGIRIDPKKFDGLISNSVHMEVDLV